jgi:hypothetical protein
MKTIGDVSNIVYRKPCDRIATVDKRHLNAGSWVRSSSFDDVRSLLQREYPFHNIVSFAHLLAYGIDRRLSVCSDVNGEDACVNDSHVRGAIDLQRGVDHTTHLPRSHRRCTSRMRSALQAIGELVHVGMSVTRLTEMV